MSVPCFTEFSRKQLSRFCQGGRVRIHPRNNLRIQPQEQLLLWNHVTQRGLRSSALRWGQRPLLRVRPQSGKLVLPNFLEFLMIQPEVNHDSIQSFHLNQEFLRVKFTSPQSKLQV